MTVTEAVKLSGLTPSADYTGVETTDDFLLAVQTEAGNPSRWACLPTRGAACPAGCQPFSRAASSSSSCLRRAALSTRSTIWAAGTACG